MKNDTDTVVSITKVTDSIETAVQEAINLAGGMHSVVNQGDEVYLKPNFVAPRHSSTGVTTDFEVIRVVAQEVHRCGAIPILYETPAIEFDRDTVYDVLGVRDFAQKNNIRLIDGKIDLVKVPVPGGKVFKKIRIPRFLNQAKIINLPKLKTHVNTKITCGMKNLIGLLPDAEKRSVHIWGVDRTVADISRVFQPILTVVDAISCVEGDGPTYGDKIDLGLIVAGKDMVSVDKICSQVIRLPWDQVKYITMLDGTASQDKIRVMGIPIEEISVPFRIPEKSTFYQLSTKMIHIIDVPFSKLSKKHLNQFLFSTGHVGTNPKIIKEKCDQCGHCVEVCPIDNVLHPESYKIDYKNCVRCLDCYFACERNAIGVKGFSRPEEK